MRNARYQTHVVLAAIGLLFSFMAGIFTESTVALMPIIYIRAWSEKYLHLSEEASVFITFMSPTLFSIIFYLWNANLFKQQPKITLRSILLFILTTLGAAYWQLAHGLHPLRSLNVEKISRLHIANIGFFVVLCLLLYLNKKHASFVKSLLFNFLLFTWIITCAFPWYFPTF